MKVLSGGTLRVPVKIWADELEAEAEKQLRNLATLPILHHHVAVMPDVHAGRGSTVGTVIATKGAIIPAAVGVDIGCGMAAVQLPFGIDRIERLPELRQKIEWAVPVGRRGHKEISDEAGRVLKALGSPNANIPLRDKMPLQLGSLGGGNHFIEIAFDEKGAAWIVIHSGSRNVGKTLADYHIAKAGLEMKRQLLQLPDPDLAYFVQGTKEFQAYLKDLAWAQNYALQNRNELMRLVLRAVSNHVFGDNRLQLSQLRVVNCHHNYSAQENHFGANVWVTRKGAVSAKEGEWGIIPGSMGTKSYIVTGKGNAESFQSCSHGAGRRMSRTKAKAQFTVRDLKSQTQGVECRKDESTLDEIPAAYKDIDVVMAQQTDLVDVQHVLKQVLCVKG